MSSSKRYNSTPNDYDHALLKANRFRLLLEFSVIWKVLLLSSSETAPVLLSWQPLYLVVASRKFFSARPEERRSCSIETQLGSDLAEVCL